ncbi:metal-dependent transcriptional regulator [Candidatus Bathyarchaeota archaeon]|nr:metal-dependent transcriptional regulator [Candidatus Bathyarchaeota archaeon]
MESALSYEAEEYIEAIYKIQRCSGVAKTKELAEELHVVPGSITNTIEHLKTHGLVEHKPYKGVKLTAKGERLALDILRRHRLAERLLTDILDAEWSTVHENACKLEHALTKEVIQLLEKRLGNPKVCPHGNPIPTENGKIEEEKCIRLTEIGLNTVCKVAKITNEKHETLLQLSSKRIKPGVLIHIIKKNPKNMVLCIAGKERIITNDYASNIWIKPLEVNNHAVQA